MIPAEGDLVWQGNWHFVNLQITAIKRVTVKSIQVASASWFAAINSCKMLLRNANTVLSVPPSFVHSVA